MKKYFVLNDTRSGLHHGCEVVMQNLFNTINKYNSDVQIASLFTGQNITKEAWIECLKEIDKVIINGEGTLHDGASYGKFLLELGYIAKQQGKQVYLINTTWQNNPSEWLSYIQNFNAISLRDQESFNTLYNANINNIFYAPDLTFNSIHTKKIKTERLPTSIIINDSIFSQISDQLFSFAKKHQSNYNPITKKLPQNKNQPGYNLKKTKKLRLYKLLSLLTFNYFEPRRYYQDFLYCIDDTIEFKSKLLHSDLVITGRYHCLCFCLQMQIPVLIISSNTNKTFNLIEDIGLKNRHITTTDLKNRSLDQLYQMACYTEQEITYLNRFQERAYQLHQIIFDQIIGE